ncbi:hypothetical protein A2G96_27110 [Cupriavidus nantongensis]|uniref:Uncharacterized protein n=1 Tax=Cupriavidus nantongensis TaxID=1796606 RepID=A0A142JTQ2_9BURK|nr:hypothetical protein A2G96_27110 [Cupriavidus nantongensis]
MQACAALGGDGGLARYRLTVGSWFDHLRTRADCYVYQDKTALEIIEDVLADLPACPFPHGGQPAAAQALDLLPVPRDGFWLSHAPAGRGRPALPLRAPARRAGQSGQDDRRQSPAIAATAADAGSESLGEWPTLESFETRGTYRFPDADAARRAAQLRAQAHESRYLRYEGEGSVRALGAGERFTLTGHFDTAANEFVTLAVRHEAANNLGAEVALLLGLSDIEAGSYRNRFEAVRADAPIVPVYCPKPTAPEGQPAVVIAEGGAPLTTERDHRVRVRLPWLRAPMADPRADTAADPAQDDLTQVTAWVRVATAAAGPNWGAQSRPIPMRWQ